MTNSNIFVTVPTLSVPVVKLSKSGEPTPKTIPYAVECTLGNGKLLTFVLREFNANGKDGKLFCKVSIDLKYMVTVTLFETPNTKGFVTNDKKAITNLSPLVISHYLENFGNISTDNGKVMVDQTYLLFNTLLPLFQTEIVVKDLKSGITRKIVDLTEDRINSAWLAINSQDAIILAIQKHIKSANATQTKPATKTEPAK